MLLPCVKFSAPTPHFLFSVSAHERDLKMRLLGYYHDYDHILVCWSCYHYDLYSAAFNSIYEQELSG